MSHPHTAFMLPDHSSQFDEQLIAGAPIITLSWNSPANHTRRFRLQAKKGIEGVIPQAAGWSSLNGAPVVQMRNGDLLIMGGLSQRTHRHELMAPHSRNADERLGRRVSLTFRAFDEASVVAAADAAASATKAAEAAAWLERSRPSATLQRLESEVGWFEEAYTGAMSREYRHYMRREWGFEKRGDQELFEMLCLEGAQAGLSWATILSRRTAYRKAFHAFDIERVAQMTKEEEQRLLEAPASDGGATTIVRNRLKVASVPRNARAALKIIEEGRRWSAFSGEARPRHGYLDAFLWSFVNERPRLNRWTSAADIPSEDETSRVMSAALIDKGFNFVGPVICYALMQSCGMVVDHPLGTPEWEAARRRLVADGHLADGDGDGGGGGKGGGGKESDGQGGQSCRRSVRGESVSEGIRRALSVESTHGARNADALADEWAAEWRRRIDCWWTLTPHRESLKACIGTLGLILAQRFESRSHVGTGAAVVEPGATDSRCAWLHSEELALPSWPELPQILPDLTLPPLPRLIRPGLERLRSLADEEMRIAAAAGATQGNKQLRRTQADANIVPAVRWMMASTGATAGAALALGVASAFWRRSGRVRHRMKQTSSHGKPPSSASTP